MVSQPNSSWAWAKAERLITDPQIEIAREESCHVLSIWLRGWASQFRQKFE
jgi:hypothetical protein